MFLRQYYAIGPAQPAPPLPSPLNLVIMEDCPEKQEVCCGDSEVGLEAVVAKFRACPDLPPSQLLIGDVPECQII